MTYTSEEIQASVEKIVSSSITTPLDTLGVRRTDLSFSQVQQAAASVYMVSYNAPYYTTWLGAQRLREKVIKEKETCASLLQLIRATGRRSSPVKDLSPLSAAHAALFELEVAALNDAGITDVSKTPAFQRFTKNVDQFLNESGGSIKSGGAIVPTAQQARSSLAGTLKSLSSSHSVLIEKATYLANAISDYQAVKLPSLVAGGVITKSRQLLGNMVEELSALSETDRQQIMRDKVLDLLTAKRLVTKYGTPIALSPYYLLTGVCRPYADLNKPAEPAQVKGSSITPLGVVASNQKVGVTVDGEPSVINLYIDGSYAASLDGQLSEPFDTTLGGNQLRVKYNDTVYDFVLPASSSLLLVTLLPILTFPAGTIIAEAFFAPLKFSGNVLLSAVPGQPLRASMTIPGGGTFPAGLDIEEGSDAAIIQSGPNAGMWAVWGASSSELILIRSTPYVSDATSVPAEVGPASRRLRLKAASPLAAINSYSSISAIGGEPYSKACAALGLASGLYTESRPSSAQNIVSGLNRQTSKVDFSVDYTNTGATVTTDVTDGSVILFSTDPGVITRGSLIKVLEGQNRGSYVVASQSVDHLKVIVDSRLPFYSDHSLPLTMSIQYGVERVGIKSRSTLLASSFLCTEAGSTLLGFPSTLVTGRTSWLKFDDGLPKGVSVGDIFELYTSSPFVPSISAKILAVDGSYIQIEETISSITPPFTAAVTSTLPFCRIRIGQVANYEYLESGLNVWLGSSAQQYSYFSEFNRLLNQLLSSTYPTQLQIGTISSYLSLVSDQLDSLLLTIEGYECPQVSSIDSLLRSFRDRGSDRGADILIECQFSEFFSMDTHDSSYAGFMMKASREVVQNDLPVSKVGRLTSVSSKRVTTESEDFEYSSSDADTGMIPDPPTV